MLDKNYKTKDMSKTQINRVSNLWMDKWTYTLWTK